MYITESNFTTERTSQQLWYCRVRLHRVIGMSEREPDSTNSSISQCQTLPICLHHRVRLHEFVGITGSESIASLTSQRRTPHRRWYCRVWLCRFSFINFEIIRFLILTDKTALTDQGLLLYLHIYINLTIIPDGNILWDYIELHKSEQESTKTFVFAS
jgi:hypothetical protein